ncbi:hypothetical protein, partial [Caproiciproducens faecalis]
CNKKGTRFSTGFQMLVEVTGFGCWHTVPAFRESLRYLRGRGEFCVSPNLHRLVLTQSPLAAIKKEPGSIPDSKCWSR